ncbi:MAG: hypothetical protein QG673_769 [Pseudomonadota bacterium]|nr:hypothetical protein [Pseudomonadota bacterium]
MVIKVHKIKLSPYHKIFYTEWLINPLRNDYNIVSDQFLYGNLCPEQLRVAINNFVDGYLLFNSKIEIIEEQPYWVESSYRQELHFFANPMSDPELFQLVSKPFDLHSGELHRFFLIKYSANEYRFIASCHHILVSGLSAEGGIFTNLINYYNDNNFKFKYNRDEQISRLNSLGDTLDALVSKNLEQSKQFWHNKLNNLETLDLKFLHLNSAQALSRNVELSNDAEHNKVNTTTAPTPFNIVKELCFDFDEKVFAQTNFVSKKHKITPYLLGQIIFAYLLYRYTGQKKFGISYPTAIMEGRDFIYGAQINTSIIAYDFEHIVCLGDIAQQIKFFIAEVKNHKTFDYRYCPISEIIDGDNKGLLDIAFIQTNLKDTQFKFAHIESAKINNQLHTDLNNKLIFEQEIKNHKINFKVKYDSTAIDDNLLISFINCYKKLYQEILEDEYNNLSYNTYNNTTYNNTLYSITPHKQPHNQQPNTLNDYSIISADDYHKIIYEWNNSSTYHPGTQDTMTGNTLTNPNKIISKLLTCQILTCQTLTHQVFTHQSLMHQLLIHQLFEQQAAKTPNSIAVVYQNKQLTYQELNDRSNQLAHYLINTYQIQSDDLIALCLSQNEHTLIAILGVLKSGGAYVPIDPNYPLERIRSIIDDVKPKVLLTNTVHHNKFKPASTSAVPSTKAAVPLTNYNPNYDSNCRCSCEFIDSDEFIQLLAAQPSTNTITSTTGSNLAYVIYTSGTTGKPNGVMIEHHSLTSFILSFINFPLNNEVPLNMLSTTNYGFDIFGLEYALPLVNGYTVYLTDLLGNSKQELQLNKLDLSKYNCIQLTPSKVELLLNAINYSYDLDDGLQQSSLTSDINSNIKHKIKILIGGEVFTQGVLDKLRKLNKKLIRTQNIHLEIINVYGPTETTIWSTAALIDINANIDNVTDNTQNKNSRNNSNISIGKPLLNQTVYILDHNLNLMPIGAVGELYIGGSGLARGYLNMPELNQNKFIRNPFQTNTVETGTVKTGTVKTDTVETGVLNSINKNNRLYKTGDLARYLPDGNLEYICRNDSQIKIKGHRIELSEIETALMSYPGVIQATAALLTQNSANSSAKQEGYPSEYLAAYYTAATKLDEQAIFSQLRQNLPQYMIPNALIHLDKLPLTTNGKLDRKALPNPQSRNTNNYVAPRNELEQQICNIYAEVLEAHRTRNTKTEHQDVINQHISTHQVGIYDDFFRLGGNSILAVKLVHKLNNQVFKCDKLDAVALFKHRTIADLLDSLLNLNNNVIITPPDTNTSSQQSKLSFAQERLWFIAKYKEGNQAYNVPLIFKLTQSCKIDILLKSVQAVVARHEILRTIIKEDDSGDGYPFIVDDAIEIDIKQVNSKKNFDSVLQEDINYLFDLNQELPIKICCYQYKQKYYLSIVVHHIAFDGWSGDILIHDLVKYYEYFNNMNKLANANNIPANLTNNIDEQIGSNSNNKVNKKLINNILDLPEIQIQYTDFAVWQRNYLNSEAIQNQLNYWTNKLDSYENLNLPIDKTRPVIFDYAGKTVVFELPLQLSMQLRKCARELNVTLYSLLLSSFYLFLRIYSNQDDVVLGTMISNRHYKNIANLVGFFVNAVVLRQQINTQTKIADFIHTVFDEIIQAQLNQDIPFEKIVEKFDSNDDLSKHPIFQIMFAMQDFGGEYHNLLTEYKPVEMYQTAKFDLSLTFNNSSENLIGTIEYATSIFELSTIEGYIKTYKIILEQVAQISELKDREKQIKDIKYVDDADYKKLLIDYNSTYQEYASTKMIHQLFEKQVEKTPNNIAIIHEDKELTYRELNQKSNQLAHYIKNQYQIAPDDLIGLFLDRDENIIIAILAVLKSGGAYVPIDTNYPDGRIQYIFEDIQAKVILSNKLHKHRLEQFNLQHQQNTPILYIEQINEELEQLPPSMTANPTTMTNQYNLAYVIYTSGTTGKPKGVLQQHNNVSRLLSTTNDWYKFNTQDVWMLFHSYSFDFSVWEIWGALCYGSQLVIPTYEHTRDFELFYDLCKQKNVTVLNQTPTAFYQLMQIILTKGFPALPTLRYVIFGGEALNLTYLQAWFKVYGYTNPQLINMYGITETTVHVTYKPITQRDNINISIIGCMIPDQYAYILNQHLQPLPKGAIGELYIGGAGLAQGYLNQPELTSIKFIANPFQTRKEKIQNKNSRLYKTGDLVRYLPDNNLEYIGRNDSQIKLRGFRIELNEIEKVLTSYAGIKQCIATVKYRNNLNTKYLIGYYVRKPYININTSSKLINDWKNIYNATYTQLNTNDYKNNFIGWNSSYTGQAITHAEMCEWRDNTIDRLFKLNPRRILEIGSGSGLLLFQLIDNCEYYYAFDFSTNAVQYTQKVINSLGYADKFKASASSAANIPFEELTGTYDTVILNSIIQCFPSLHHLEELLIKIIENIDIAGKIFIGDVRDFRLLECFAYSVLNFKNNFVDISDIEYFKIKEKELLVSPEYFLYLKNNNDYIAYVELMPKFGKAVNEMNSYRYDVVLHIDKNKKTSTTQINIDKFKKIVNVADTLNNYSTANLYIKYPNFRIAKEYIRCNNLYNNQCDLSVDKAEALLDIEQLTKTFYKKGFKVTVYLDIDNPLYLNIIASNTIYSQNAGSEKVIINYQKNPLNYKNFANNPNKNIQLFDSKYTESLKKYLATRLPNYMIPQYLIPLNSIPLNSNGKVDYKSLPSPAFISNNKYVAPKTKLEKTLCEIFAQILNITKDNVGIQDNFFKIGGNSILALKLIAKIRNKLNFKLKAVDIFTNNTVQSLTGYLYQYHTNDTFNSITNLNHVSNKLNMFMIHPAFAGSEVYVELANKLSDVYSCYGVDNYNLHHETKINDITSVARLYLDSIHKIRQQSNQENKPYLLLGWSLGGQIALNIAHILEQCGYKNIYVILVDSVYPDRNFAHKLCQVTLDASKLKLFIQQIGIDPKYTAKVKNNFRCDIELSFQEVPIKLQYSKILLFKAMQKEAIIFLQNYDPLKEYALGLQYNNIDKIVNPININLIKLKNSNHFNLLAQSELIYARIMLFMNKYSIPKKSINLDCNFHVQQSS